MTIQHALGEGVRYDLALEMRYLRQAHQIGATILPALATVARAYDAVDLQRGVDFVGSVGMLRHTHDAHGERRFCPILDVRSGEPLPTLASVLAAIDIEGRRPGVYAPIIPGIHQEGPDLLTPVRKARLLERCAAVLAAPDAIDGSGEYQRRIRRMHEHSVGLQVGQ